jgi:hypothetical protein
MAEVVQVAEPTPQGGDTPEPGAPTPAADTGEQQQEESSNIAFTLVDDTDPGAGRGSDESAGMVPSGRLREESGRARRSLGNRLEQTYSRGKSGKREDLGGLYVRSRWEANYARYLNFLKKTGAIYDWKYETQTWWFEPIKRGTRSYTCDFEVWVKKDSTPYYAEIKGWMDAKSKTRLKRMAKYYPDVEIRVVGEKDYRVLSKNFSGMIKHWER